MKHRTTKALGQLNQRYSARLYGLMQEAGIDPQRPDRWMLLATELAERLERLRDEWDERKKAWIPRKSKTKKGRKELWSETRRKSLVQAMDALMDEKRRTQLQAAAILKKSKEWSQYSADSISSRYSEFKKLPERDRTRLKNQILARLVTDRLDKS
jgi:hypothetical protein